VPPGLTRRAELGYRLAVDVGESRSLRAAGLARLGRLLERFRPPRRVIPTRAGVALLFAPFVLGFAAINASNNLLFMLLGLCIGLIVLSGVVSEAVIRRLDVRLTPLGAPYVDEPFRVLVEIERGADLLSGSPLWDLVVLERPRRWRSADVPPVEDRLRAVFVVVDGPRASMTAPRSFRERGRHALLPIEVESRYPLLLLAKSKDVDAALELVVRPRRVAPPPALVDPRGLGRDGTRASRRGGDEDVYGLKERDDRDPDARVHARRSARLGREVVVEREVGERPLAELTVINHPDAEPLALERALELAQAVLVAWDARGYAVSLAMFGVEGPSLAPLEVLLDRLAVANPAAPTGFEAIRGLCLVPSGAPETIVRDRVAWRVRWDGVLEPVEGP
jgi:hypothetical protein